MGLPNNVPRLVLHTTGSIVELPRAFNKECIRSCGTTKIYNVDGLTEMSLLCSLKKYFHIIVIDTDLMNDRRMQDEN